MPGWWPRLTDIGDADAIAAHRARDADAFARWEPSRPAPMHVGAMLALGTRPDMPVTLPAAGSLADRITRVAAITRQRKTPARATSVALLGPLFRLLTSTGLLRWFVNRQWLVHGFATNLRGPAQPLTFAGAPLRPVIPYPEHHRQCPRHLRRAVLRRDTSAYCAVRPGPGTGCGNADRRHAPGTVQRVRADRRHRQRATTRAEHPRLHRYLAT